MSEAEGIAKAYWKGFPGIADFKKKGAAFVKKNGYIVMCKKSGHRMNWYGHDKWIEEQNSYTQEFWEEYRLKHKGTGDYVAQAVSSHAKIGSKWERYALNAPTQGTGSVIMKHAMVLLYRWIVRNDLFNTVKLCAIVHDEACIEYPETMPEVADRLKEFMERAAAVYCASLPIPAEAAVGKHWIH